MKINKDMYVRTKDGFIDKVTIDYEGYCNSPTCNCKHVSCEHNYYDEDEIIKASNNIIDLIEAGDYVNGNKVIRIETSSYPEDKNVKIIVCCGDDDYYVYYNEDIKTILTKEQYESNCYKGEE